MTATREALRVGLVALESKPGLGGGADIYTRLVVEALAESSVGSEIQLVVLAAEGALPAWPKRDWPPHVAFKPLRYSAHPLGTGRRLERILRRAFRLPLAPVDGERFLARQIDEMKLDVVHFPRTVMYPRPIRTPSVLTVFDIQHEYLPEFFTPLELEWRGRSYLPSATAASLIVAPSEFTKGTLEEKFKIPSERMVVIPVGVGRPVHRRTADEVAEVRGRFGLPSRFIVYPANPWQHKNHGRLMAALRLCKDRLGECPPLVLFGRLTSETRDYRSVAQAAGVEDHVVDLGFVQPEDMPAVYSAATFMVFPSLFEGFGIPVMEALACGCPVAASDRTSIPEVAGDGALLFDPTQVGQMADAMHALWTNEELRQSLATRGLRRARVFDSEQIVRKLLEAYLRASRARRLA